MPTPTRRLLAVALLWPLAAAASAADYPGPYTATVTRVVDGDTVHVRVRLWPGLEYAGPLRVAGVDTPELRARHTCERQLAAAARDYVARRLRGATIERAVQRLYGSRCFWWADSGLRGYGQVMRPCRTGGSSGSSAVTYRASLDVDMPTLPEAHIAALEARAAEERALYEQMERDYQAGLADGRSGGAPGRTRSDATFDYERGYRDGVAMRADIDDLEG